MKKMSEVFNGNPCGFSPRMTDEQVRHGQHAINHVDALAESLSAMVSMFERLCEANDFDVDRQAEYVDAKAAIVAYRGKL